MNYNKIHKLLVVDIAGVRRKKKKKTKQSKIAKDFELGERMQKMSVKKKFDDAVNSLITILVKKMI